MSRLVPTPKELIEQLLRLLPHPAPAGPKPGPGTEERILDAALAAFTARGVRATWRTMCTCPRVAATRAGGPHFFCGGARYDDELVRTEAGWKIAQRVETTLWFQGSLPPELLMKRD